jgi:ABC-2 type transport system ATP-binding protein
MPDGQALVETRAVTKTFGSVQAVRDVSFTVGRGEVIGFLGPNGAGKSTTMKIIAGFLEPTSGEAFVAGYDSRREPAILVISRRAHPPIRI